MKFKFAGALASASLMLAATASAAVIPVGPQNDVALSTVTGAWGWTLNYQGAYNQFADLSTLFAGVDQDDYVMLAGIVTGSDTIDVLAAAKLSDVMTYTPLNTPHLANGANWYFNGNSMGFAGAGDSINQTSADTAGTSERDRLSWHTSILPAAGFNFSQDPNQIPLSILVGWRSGNNTHLNDTSGFTRMVFVLEGDSIPGVPEPATWACMIMGFGAAGSVLRRRRTAGA